MNYPSLHAELFAADIRKAKRGDKVAMQNLRVMLSECFADALARDVPDDVIIRVSKLLLEIRFEDATKTLEVE